MKTTKPLRLAAATGLLACAFFVHAQAIRLVQSTDLRSDKLPTAPVVQALPQGASVQLLSLEGGWAWVRSGNTNGWVRASSLELSPNTLPGATGRSSIAKAPIGMMGVRSIAARPTRHALVIGVGKYADPGVPPLPGTRLDRQSATQIAEAMGIPQENTEYLQDEEATAAGIRAALRKLGTKVQDGDRVFIHYSGHGTRYQDPQTGNCTEALLAHDGGTAGRISHREMADLLSPISRKTDKLFVMYDACYSGGIAKLDPATRTRGVKVASDEGALRPKFSAVEDACSRPSNVKTRNLVVEAESKGTPTPNIVHLSSSRENEVSFDDEQKGGLATQFVRDCMLRDAVDLDGSGAISIDEIRQCAQKKIEKRLEKETMFRPHNLTLTGNEAFVPVWFSVGQLAPIASTPAPAAPAPAAPAAPTATTPAASAPATPVAVAPPAAPAAPSAPAAPPPQLTGQQALQQLFDQRDARRRVDVAVPRPRVKIGEPLPPLEVKSGEAGYVYIALAGSDNKAVYMLFPNKLDQDNAVRRGETLKLPRPSWQVRAAGPSGANHLLVMVTDTPRDIGPLLASGSTFGEASNDSQGRAILGALLTSGRTDASACRSQAGRPGSCSDAFGARLVKIEEYP